MKVNLEIYLLIFFLTIVQQNNCYSQLNYDELPDTIYQEYKDRHIVEQIIPKSLWRNYYMQIPVKLKNIRKDIIIKKIYKDCDDCIYEEYIDSLEIQAAYNKILLRKEVKYKYEIDLKSQAERAWVKVYEKIPEAHTPCLDVVGIDTCLWKHLIIKEAKYDTLLKKRMTHIPDTIRIPPLIIPIKKYRLKNKSKQEIEKLISIDVETVSVGFYIIEEEEKIYSHGHINNIETRRKNVRVLFKAKTPLNYDD